MFLQLKCRFPEPGGWGSPSRRGVLIPGVLHSRVVLHPRGVLRLGGFSILGGLHLGGGGILHLGGFSILEGSQSRGVLHPGGSLSRGWWLSIGGFSILGGMSCDLSHHAFDVTCMLPPHQLSGSTCAAPYIV